MMSIYPYILFVMGFWFIHTSVSASCDVRHDESHKQFRDIQNQDCEAGFKVYSLVFFVFFF